MGVELFRTRASYGLCANIDPFSSKATLLLNILEPIVEYCDMPDCHEKVVRVSVHETFIPYSGKEGSEFRGLCERHKQQGMWNNNGGWS